jgi:hypothetical protein
MNRILFFTVATISAALFSGCEPKYSYLTADYDFNTDVVVFIQNSNGDNLLDSGFEGNILDNNITVEFEGDTFSIGDVKHTKQENISLLITPYRYNTSPQVLRFGSFMPDNSRLREFTINLGDGAKYRIAFEYNAVWSWVEYAESREYWEEAACSYKIWLNDELESEEGLTITLTIRK